MRRRVRWQFVDAFLGPENKLVDFLASLFSNFAITHQTVDEPPLAGISAGAAFNRGKKDSSPVVFVHYACPQ